MASFRATVNEFGALRDIMLETHSRNHAGGYFGRIVQRPSVASADELEPLIEAAIDDGILVQDTAAV